MSFALRSTCMLAGIGLAGASALQGCARGDDGVDAQALAQCHRTIQRATLAVQVAGPVMTYEERSAARRQLEDADHRLLHVWAQEEGLSISAAQFAEEAPKAVAFIEGIDAEAGLSEQEKLSALSAAADAPEAWRDHVSRALDSTGRLTS